MLLDSSTRETYQTPATLLFILNHNSERQPADIIPCYLPISLHSNLKSTRSMWQKRHLFFQLAQINAQLSLQQTCQR